MSTALASFRDPGGSLFSSGSRILRKVLPSSAGAVRQFLRTRTAEDLVRSGKLIATSETAPAGTGGLLLEHDRVWFPSYPYEWPAEMLCAAGELTLELARDTLGDGFGLKDATPYNVLFRGPNPVFVDILSFEQREPSDPTWLPYAQFVRMFLLPLLMNREFGLRANQTLFAHGSGLEPEFVYESCSWTQRLRPPFLGTVSLPTWLSKKADSNGERLYNQPKHTEPDKARFILETQFRRLKKLLHRAAPASNATSVWSSYTETFTYNEAEYETKAKLVREWLAFLSPQTVLDVGCNTGFFSELAANAGAKVVAIDGDPVVVGKTWRRAVEKKLNILPLVLDIARPTPATGWYNAECLSFLDRASGSFEVVLMLAVLHHLLVTERVPLPEVLRLAAQLTDGYVVLEYVSKDDPMFRKLMRGRGGLHASFTKEYFESTCLESFTIVRKQKLKDDLRWLYLLRKRGLPAASQ